VRHPDVSDDVVLVAILVGVLLVVVWVWR